VNLDTAKIFTWLSMSNSADFIKPFLFNLEKKNFRTFSGSFIICIHINKKNDEMVDDLLDIPLKISVTNFTVVRTMLHKSFESFFTVNKIGKRKSLPATQFLQIDTLQQRRMID
jgi:hypothetical protein